MFLGSILRFWGFLGSIWFSWGYLGSIWRSWGLLGSIWLLKRIFDAICIVPAIFALFGMSWEVKSHNVGKISINSTGDVDFFPPFISQSLLFSSFTLATFVPIFTWKLKK